MKCVLSLLKVLCMFMYIFVLKNLAYVDRNILKNCAPLNADGNDPEIGNELQKFQMPEVLSDYLLHPPTPPAPFNGSLAVKFLPFAHLGFSSPKIRSLVNCYQIWGWWSYNTPSRRKKNPNKKISWLYTSDHYKKLENAWFQYLTQNCGLFLCKTIFISKFNFSRWILWSFAWYYVYQQTAFACISGITVYQSSE